MIDVENNDKIGIQSLYDEYKRSKKLGTEHPHFAKGIDHKQIKKGAKSQRVEILFEYSGESLLHLMNNSLLEMLKIKLKIWIIQSLSALMYMEARKISHLDIKPQNIVYQNGTTKVIDFGSSIGFSTKFQPQKVLLKKGDLFREYTPEYCPPEVLGKDVSEDNYIPGKIDTFCWGMTIYHLVLRKSELEMKELSYKRSTISETDYNLNFIEPLMENRELSDYDPSGLTAKILIKCLQFNPDKRPSFKEIHEEIKEKEDEGYESSSSCLNAYSQIGYSYYVYCQEFELAHYYLMKAIKLPKMKKKQENLKTKRLICLTILG